MKSSNIIPQEIKGSKMLNLIKLNGDMVKNEI